MNTHLWWGNERVVADWVGERAVPGGARFKSGRAVGWINDAGELVGGLVLLPRGGFFDAELHIAFKPGWARHTRRKQFAELFRLAFDEWGLSRLTLIVRSDDTRTLRFVRPLGFQREGVKRRGYDGTSDGVLLGMLRDDCAMTER